MLFASLIFRIPHSQFRIQIEFPLKASFRGQKGRFKTENRPSFDSFYHNIWELAWSDRKQLQSYDFEDIRVLTYDRLKNMGELLYKGCPLTNKQACIKNVLHC